MVRIGLCAQTAAGVGVPATSPATWLFRKPRRRTLGCHDCGRRALCCGRDLARLLWFSPLPTRTLERMNRLLVATRLPIGAVAKGQRGYFGALSQNCAGAPTVVVTVVAGPLNYLGVNLESSADRRMRRAELGAMGLT
jgi:hypothetical protein